MKNPENNRIFPFVWPWKGVNNQTLSWTQLAKQKAFSISYLIVIWSIIGILGFASTRNCEGSWQIALQCDFAFWVKNLREDPLIFVRNMFTTLFLHNGFDHILFVSVIGILIIVQSHEAIFGFKTTALIFISAYMTVAPFFGAFYTVGLDLYPDSQFMQFAFARNWMGGSIGMFQVYGALATKSRKPLVMLMIPVFFELFNLFVFGIDLHISLMHVMSTFVGYGLSLWLVKK
ncbi:hypothetical protein SAMN05421640_0270 [Ekhidna lutea]|uniref:Membrane associated serine protease, rhomboid family n=1 Tax=Ekhidna lutea TaxID=447679 RepID=A0A239EQR1_EKHLU|nr:hypothetical protein [Ekhidna lutea]SNS46751.1 hypothetical protein SAMN05421640_0270 [Ekhidna lutea]